MGLYFRKSLRLGPLRLNLSRSGLGVSTGVPGLRMGVGPRGSYMHAGRGGLYYRKSLKRPLTSIRSSDTVQDTWIQVSSFA
jgi:hypothetical protein